MDTWSLIVALLACLLAAGALVVAVVAYRASASISRSGTDGADAAAQADSAAAAEPPPTGPPAIIVNPVKLNDLDAFKERCTQIARQCNLPEPLFFETSEDHQGHSQAREAVAKGASVVVAAGGDGTVRQVARGLAGTGVPLGLVPMGTGNLLARNLDIPLGSVSDQITAAFTGPTRAMDVGWLKAEPLRDEEALEAATAKRFANLLTDEGAVPAPKPDREYLFLVIAGLGFDAAMVAGADDDLKARIGWLAYSVAAIKHMTGRRIDARMWIGGAENPEHQRARTIMFANCGRLPGGVVLLPDAQLDDGWLDIATIDTTVGLLGWAAVGGKILLQGLGIRRDQPGPLPGSMTFRRGKSVRVSTAEPEAVQVDGDLVGISRHIETRVERGALLVRS